MPFLSLEGTQPAGQPTYSPITVESYLKRGYKVVSDGPSGVQLEGPRRMRISTKITFVAAVLSSFVYWPAALVLSVFVIIDYFALTHTDKVFLHRKAESSAAMPGEPSV